MSGARGRHTRLAGVTILLVGVAVLPCLAPARRAASIDPMDAVRHEQQANAHLRAD